MHNCTRCGGRTQSKRWTDELNLRSITTTHGKYISIEEWTFGGHDAIEAGIDCLFSTKLSIEFAMWASSSIRLCRFVSETVTQTCCGKIYWYSFHICSVGISFGVMMHMLLPLLLLSRYCWGSLSPSHVLFAFLFVFVLRVVCTRYHFQDRMKWVPHICTFIFVFAGVDVIYAAQSAVSACKTNKTEFVLLGKHDEPNAQSLAAINFPSAIPIDVTSYEFAQWNSNNKEIVYHFSVFPFVFYCFVYKSINGGLMNTSNWHGMHPRLGYWALTQ